jgi:hypothetical protein
MREDKMITALILFPLLPLMTCFELVKRVIGLFVYPVAYWLIKWPRTSKGVLWAFMDDSIVLDSLARCGKPLPYCCYGKREPLNFITEKLSPGPFQEWFRAWNWNSWRNSAINLRDEMAAGPMLYVIKHIGGAKSYYEARRFKNVALPYLEVWFGSYRLQAGWLKGGFWQVQFRKL